MDALLAAYGDEEEEEEQPQPAAAATDGPAAMDQTTDGPPVNANKKRKSMESDTPTNTTTSSKPAGEPSRPTKKIALPPPSFGNHTTSTFDTHTSVHAPHYSRFSSSSSPTTRTTTTTTTTSTTTAIRTPSPASSNKLRPPQLRRGVPNASTEELVTYDTVAAAKKKAI
jgi:hypothetical protein